VSPALDRADFAATYKLPTIFKRYTEGISHGGP
jgi:hypothetical protein